jgi:ribonuclease P protein component
MSDVEMTEPTTTASFRPHEHIRQRVEFQQIYERGAKIHNRYAIVFILPTDRAWSRLGIAATKKLGGAVVRNRAKRLIRETFRHCNVAGATPALDIVVVPKRELLDASLNALETEYRSILAKYLGRRRGAGSHQRL